MGFISSIALFLPIFVLLFFRLGGYKSFPALFAYYSMVFAYNLLTEGYISVGKDVISNWNICNNLLDAPLMLLKELSELLSSELEQNPVLEEEEIAEQDYENIHSCYSVV